DDGLARAHLALLLEMRVDARAVRPGSRQSFPALDEVGIGKLAELLLGFATAAVGPAAAAGQALALGCCLLLRRFIVVVGGHTHAAALLGPCLRKRRLILLMRAGTPCPRRRDDIRLLLADHLGALHPR